MRVELLILDVTFSIMNFRILRISYHFRREIWAGGRVPFDREHWKIFLEQRLYMVFHGLLIKEHWMSAAQLTYNTLMAIIPVFAIVYAIASGFGFGDVIIEECRKAFRAQPQVAEALVSLSKNYIHYTHTGIVLGISFVFMLYSVLSLFNNIETVFNRIWGTRAERSIGRMVVDYTSMLFIVPIVIILFSGLSVFFYTMLGYLPSFQVLTPFVKIVLKVVVPLVVLTLFFISFYSYIPNVPVQLRHVVIPSLLASVFVIILQVVLLHFQIIFTSYSIIYGSLAALPLLMLWLQLSWYICIGFAELAHANQEIGRGNLYEDREESMETQLYYCTVVMSLLCQRQERGSSPMSMKDLLDETQMGYHSLQRCLRLLTMARLVHDDLSNKNDGKDVYLLRKNSNITIGEMTKAIVQSPYTTISRQVAWRMTPAMRASLQKLLDEYYEALNGLKVVDSAERKPSSAPQS